MAGDWSRLEVEAVVADYFDMWVKELRHERFNKSAHNKALQASLEERNHGSIEFKHANISAVLIELGLPYIDGYKPRGNYQELLRQVIVERLSANPGLEALAKSAVLAPSTSVPKGEAWDTVIVPPPVAREPRTPYRVSESRVNAGKVNYLELEARNSSLGLAGEKFVLELEDRRLRAAGKRGFAERIEHVAAHTDGLGYDIKSFEEDGRERLIEVKTTRYGEMTPFFASRKEVAVSEEQASAYRLFRVFRFDHGPKAFVLPGSLKESASLEPVTYQASVRAGY
jgi:hypothetical protein